MSSQCVKLCSKVLEETFGRPVRMVADVILTRGPCPFRHILTAIGNNLPVTAIQDALKLMIQQFVVTYSPNPTSGEIIYTINHDRAIELSRFARYYHLMDTTMGPIGYQVFQEVAQAGLIPISKLIYVCGFRVTTSDPETKEAVLTEKLTEFQTTVLKLVKKKLIMIVPPPPPPITDDMQVVEEGGSGKDLFKMPSVDIKLLVDKLLKHKDAVKLESLPDSGTLWGINVSQLQAELRNSVIYSGIERKFKSMIDTRVIQIIIEAGFEKHPWEDEGTPVSLPEIKDRLEKLPDGAETSKNVLEHIEVVEDDPMRMVTKLSNTQGGYFSFNMKTAVSELLWSTVDRIIAQKHGFQALRIFRLVKDKGFVEQDSINELGMIPGKDAKHLTYQLVADNYINIKEVKKSYTANAPPGKTCHVFCVDPIQIVRTVQSQSYKAILNMKIKSEQEQERIKILTEKEGKTNRILAQMANKKCTEEQLEEIRELLTPPERSLLTKYESAYAKLLSGTVHIEETLFITELYMKYHANVKKSLPVPKSAGGKKEQKARVA